MDEPADTDQRASSRTGAKAALWLSPSDQQRLGAVDLSPEPRLVAASLSDAASSRAFRVWASAKAPDLLLLPTFDLALAAEIASPAIDATAAIRLGREIRAILDGRNPSLDGLGKRVGEAIAEKVFELEIANGATCLMPMTNPLVDQRFDRPLENNLVLLDAAIRVFQQADLHTPPPDITTRKPQRTLYAPLSVVAHVLSDARLVRRVVEGLLERSGAVDGFWVQFPDLNSQSSLATVQLVRTLLFDLQEQGGRPVIVDRVGTFGLALLSGGLDGCCFGTDDGGFLRHTQSRRREDSPRFFFSHKLLRNFPITGPHAERGRRAGILFPCNCGHHNGRPFPDGDTEEIRHALWWHWELANQITSDGVRSGRSRFVELVRSAERSARRVSVGNEAYYSSLRELAAQDGRTRLAEA